MRITVEIDASAMKQIQKAARQKKKSPAVSWALAQFLKQQQRQKFLERVLSGRTDYALTNEQLEARDAYEARG